MRIVILFFVGTASLMSVLRAFFLEQEQPSFTFSSERSAVTERDTNNPPHQIKHRHWCRTPEEYTRGRWIYSNASSFPYWSEPDPIWGRRCTAQQEQYLQSGNASDMVPAFLRYSWQPDSCDLDQEWNHPRFCQRLNGKTIGVSGDSMSQQFVHSIMGYSRGIVGNHVPFLVDQQWPGKPGHWTKLRIPLCEQYESSDYNNVTLTYQRWDKYTGDDLDRQALSELIDESDYLILNWGVHYQVWSDMESATDSFVNVLEQKWRPPHKKPERLFWRSTNVAHENCATATQPLGPAVSDNTTTAVIHHLYNTQEILMQDEYIVKPRLLAKLPHTTLLRIEEATLRRPDGHRVEGPQGQEDCLHYCEPGPIDHWSLLFYHHVMALGI